MDKLTIELLRTLRERHRLPILDRDILDIQSIVDHYICQARAEGASEEREHLKPLMKQAAQLAKIADDWHLPEVEIDGEWILTRDLARAFREAIRNEEE